MPEAKPAREVLADLGVELLADPVGQKQTEIRLFRIEPRSLLTMHSGNLVNMNVRQSAVNHFVQVIVSAGLVTLPPAPTPVDERPAVVVARGHVEDVQREAVRAFGHSAVATAKDELENVLASARSSFQQERAARDAAIEGPRATLEHALLTLCRACDEMRELKRRAEVEAQQGHAIKIPTDEPWPDPVNGARLLDRIASTIRRYIVLRRGRSEAIALWTLHTHVFDRFDITPLLLISSPGPGYGKSNLLSIVARVVRRFFPTTNITSAALYRTVEGQQPTLIIDEFDTQPAHEALRGLLNAGHRRDLAYVVRSAGKDGVHRYSTWCPKALGCIGPLAATLEDRAIRISMRQKLSTERRKRLMLNDLDAALSPLRRMAARWAEDHQEQLTASPRVPDEMDGRDADNWIPLLSIADAVGGRWPKLARACAVEMSRERREDENYEQRQRLVQWIGRRGGAVSVRDVTHGLREYRRNPDAAEAALSGLVSAGLARWRPADSGPQGGRPSRLCRLVTKTSGNGPAAKVPVTESRGRP